MTNPRPSISFDRAADIYDATRALPAEVASAITEALLREIAAIGGESGLPIGRKVLEVGIGTGRIARPLAEHGVRVCGVDISRLMMERLAAQVTARQTAPDLVLADATRLPLADASFGVVLSFHVLHLVPDWEPAAEEAARVLAPGGAFIHYQRRDEYEAWRESGDKWDELLAARGFERRKRPSIEDIGGKLESLGGSCRLLEVAREEERETPNGMVELTRSRAHSWSWEIPDDLFWGCMPEYEEWMRGRYADMDEVVVNPVVHELRVWRWESRRA